MSGARASALPRPPAASLAAAAAASSPSPSPSPSPSLPSSSRLPAAGAPASSPAPASDSPVGAGGLVAELLRLLLANVPAWPAPPPETLAALAPLLSTRRLPAGALVLAQGQATPALFGVLSGAVEIRLGAVDGAVSVVEVTGPLRLFGLASFASGLPSTYEALTQAPTRLLVIGPAAYGHLMDRVPGFGRALMSEFARRHDTTLRLLTEARHLGAMERLTLVLDRLADEQQSQAPRDAHGALGLAATQADLAQRAGLSRQTVNALLSRLQAQGRLRRAYGRLWLAPTPPKNNPVNARGR